MVQFFTIHVSHTSLRWQWENVDQILNSQQTPHTSPSSASYGVSSISILAKIDCIITVLYVYLGFWWIFLASLVAPMGYKCVGEHQCIVGCVRIFILIHWPLGGVTIILTHWGRDKVAAIFQTTFSNAFSWMKIYKFLLRFHWFVR